MVNQKLISLKLDDDLLSRLDSLCSEYGVKRNRMINVLVRSGIECLLAKRSYFMNLSVLSSPKVYTLLQF